MKSSLIILLVLFTLISCSSRPEPIAYGKDQCSYCKMTIADPKFGAELITDKGRILKYDAAECMVNHLHGMNVTYSQLLAVAYDQPKKLMEVDSLKFIISPTYRSPMGANLAAFSNPASFETEAEVFSWDQVYQKLTEY